MSKEDKKRLRSMIRYDAPLGPIAAVVYFVRSHLKAELGGLALLLLAVAVAAFVTNANSPEPKPARVELKNVALTGETVEAWSQAAAALAERRDQGSVRFPGGSLPAFIAWGRAEPAAIEKFAPGMTAADFLSTCRAIEAVRRKLRELIAFDQRWEELNGAAGALEERVGTVRLPSPPPLGPEDKKNIEAYETHAAVLEPALYALFPDLPDIYPPEPGEQVGKEGEAQASEGKARKAGKGVSWRVVNRSRYGPRVLRTR